jgi:AI-2 transport protein TqsA
MATSEHPPDGRVVQTCLIILTLLASAAALAWLRAVLVPFLLAVFLSFFLAPLIDWQVRRLRFPAALAVATTSLLGLGLLALLGFGAAASLSTLAAQIAPYQERLHLLLDRIEVAVPLEKLGLAPRENGEPLRLSNEAAASLFSAVITMLRELISGGTLVVVFLINILLTRQIAPEVPGPLAEVRRRSQRFLMEFVGISGITGILVGVLLALLGVPFAFVFGFLAFLLNFIPAVGSVVASFLPLPVLLLHPDLSPTVRVVGFAGPSLIQFVIGNFVQPRIYGRSMRLHPVTLILALVFFGSVWGVVGAFLAVPTTAVIRILLDQFEPTRPFADAMTGDLARLLPTSAAKLSPPPPPVY